MTRQKNHLLYTNLWMNPRLWLDDLTNESIHVYV